MILRIVNDGTILKRAMMSLAPLPGHARMPVLEAGYDQILLPMRKVVVWLILIEKRPFLFGEAINH